MKMVMNYARPCMGLAVSWLPDRFLPKKLHQPIHTGIQQLNINIICSIIKSTRCYTKFDDRLQSLTNAKIIRTPDTHHRPPLIWVGVLVGPHIEISVLPFLARGVEDQRSGWYAPMRVLTPLLDPIISKLVAKLSKV
jgi:hypothetical protein